MPGQAGAPTGVIADADAVLSALERFYGSLPMPPSDPFRAYVWEVLAMQAGSARRDAAFLALQRLRALTPDAMARAPRKPFEAAVALAGAYQEQRLAALRAGMEQFRRSRVLGDDMRGPLRHARRALLLLPRTGAGSLHRLLLFAGGHCVQPVDPEIARVWRRITGSAPTLSHPGRIRKAIERSLPREVDTFRRAAVYLRHHALQTCTPDPHCPVCPLRAWCPGRSPGASAPASLS